MNKLLIYTDLHKQSDFENEVETVQNETNRLIELYHNFQSWNKIKTIEDFEALCKDPLKAMDQALIKYSGFDPKQTGGKLPNPSKVADILDIDYINFNNICKGLKVTEGSCKPCGKLKIVQSGKGVINITVFKKYQEYLLFDEGRFLINENEVKKKTDSFKIYAETQNQIEIFNHWHDLCNMLNDSAIMGYIGSDVLDKIPGLFKNRLTFSYQAGKLSVDIQSLNFEIQNIKN